MQEITLNNQNYLLVEVPNKYVNFKIIYYPYSGTWVMEEKCSSLNNWKERIGKFEQDALKLIGKISDILKNEDVCKGLVENFIFNKNEGFTNYQYEFISELKATDSFLSYLQSINLDMSKEYLFIRKL